MQHLIWICTVCMEPTYDSLPNSRLFAGHKNIKNIESPIWHKWVTWADPKGGGSDRGSETPTPLENHVAIGFLRNSDKDPPPPPQEAIGPRGPIAFRERFLRLCEIPLMTKKKY